MGMPRMRARLTATMGLTTLWAAPLSARVHGSTGSTADVDTTVVGQRFMDAAAMEGAVGTTASSRDMAVVNSTVEGRFAVAEGSIALGQREAVSFMAAVKGMAEEGSMVAVGGMEEAAGKR